MCNVEYDGNGDESRGLLGCSKIAAVENSVDVKGTVKAAASEK